MVEHGHWAVGSGGLRGQNETADGACPKQSIDIESAEGEYEKVDGAEDESEINASRVVRNGVTASAVRSTPNTVHGWRPTSAVNQPVRMAIWGKGKLKNMHQSNGRFCSMRPLALR